ncbi:hypothetical protein SAMN04488057_117104 [Cyclobacterium lianum]|uniref:Uncharacterized protein n=1 Tax=Cyclobacterium lianum TaxID=388280 RepID=A0A1M7QGI3_9BACT|nr:hypothetical protein [Cyclobacterium lianum]SHN29804.1 hypothetical protein SAMN04488057_117104 [Cyclobacterium lianum]
MGRKSLISNDEIINLPVKFFKNSIDNRLYTLTIRLMFGFFKKSKEKEFYERMEKCRKAWDFLSKNNPFEAVPNEVSKHSKILKDNRVWVQENIKDLKPYLDSSQLEQVRKAFGFSLTYDWIKDDEK